MPAEKAGQEADDVSESTQTRSGFQGQGRTYGAARRRDGAGAGGPFRSSSAPDLRLEKGAYECGAQGLRRTSGADRPASLKCPRFEVESVTQRRRTNEGQPIQRGTDHRDPARA